MANLRPDTHELPNNTYYDKKRNREYNPEHNPLGFKSADSCRKAVEEVIQEGNLNKLYNGQGPMGCDDGTADRMRDK